ncbi:MAG TPA: hypothetical protein VGX91_11410 [Candidatus Cybelea sp.]|jgi:hypothetical protein|nr:hypothetical protein [Candidatus Cybelea sp.]
MYVSKSRLGALALGFALLFAGAGAGTALAYQGHMANARMYLNDALTNLNQAQNDKAGHRLQAISLVKNALQQVELGIKAGAQ